jgi:clan AA aspartic protease
MPTIKLTNMFDVQKAEEGIGTGEIRSLETAALVDTGATQLVITEEVRQKLGLKARGIRKVRYANGQIAEILWVRGVLLEILGREMVCGALVESGAGNILIGQIPLEELDLVVDPKSRELRVNPESPDMPLLDILAYS